VAAVLWIGLLVTCGLVGLTMVVAVGRRSYRQARELIHELGHLVGDVDAVLAHVEPPADRRDATRAGPRPPRA
jgi:hypothetical protein